MMGRYTPVFRVLCAALPWFFRLPYAVYYRFAVCWGLLILAAIGTDAWVRNSFEARPMVLHWKIPLAVFLASLVLGGVALLVPASFLTDKGAEIRMPGHASLTWFKEWSWFLRWPIPAFLIAAGWSVLIATQRGRFAGRWLLAGLFVERSVLAAVFLYVSMVAVQQRRPAAGGIATSGLRRIQSLQDSGAFRLAREVSTLTRGENWRWTSFTAIRDNQAWSTGTHSLLGYAAKPLQAGMTDLIGQFTKGAPFNAVMYRVPIVFLRNMSVRFLTYPTGDDSLPLRRLKETDGFLVDEIDDPLPYAYTQDRILRVDEPAALKHLLETDLKRAAFVAFDPPENVPVAEPPPASLAPSEELRRFRTLQAANRVVRVDRSVPNRITVEVDMDRPAMLILTECWHPGWRAKTGGTSLPVWRVNGLLQGMWLEKGHRRVELSFFPESMRIGIVVSAVAILLVAAVGFWPRRKKHRGIVEES